MQINQIQSNDKTAFKGIRNYCNRGSYSYSTSIVEKAINNSKILQKYIHNNDVDITIKSWGEWYKEYSVMELTIEKIFPIPPKPTKLIDKIKRWFNGYDIPRKIEKIRIAAFSNEHSGILLEKDLTERINKIKTDSDLEDHIIRYYV